jgi:hypothetical protein
MEGSIESTSTLKEVDNLLVEKAVELSLIEILLGSLLHNLHVPFAGHFLSLNQSYFYSSYQRDFKSRITSMKFLIELSVIVSLMKSLSPSFKKLGPMMSISMQGLLYSLGIVLFGVNLAGQILGAMFSSLWAFIQPLISLFLLYGFELIHAYDYYDKLFSKYFSGSLNIILFVFIFFKLFLALLTPFLARYLPPSFLLEKSHGYLKKKKEINQERKGLLIDLTKPLFLLSFILMFCFFYLQSEDQVALFYRFARFISVSLLICFLLRSVWIKRQVIKTVGRSRRGKELISKANFAYQKILELS